MLKQKFMVELDGLVIQEVNGFKGLYATRQFKKGEVVCLVEGEEISDANRYSVQVSKNIHVNVKEPVMYINHNCSGNIELVGRKFIAIQEIKPYDEISFNYLITEDILAESFECSRCGQIVKGKNYIFDLPCKLSTV